MADGERVATTGRCLCGDIRFEFDGPPRETGYCHCESCRRHTSAPVTVYIEVERSRFRFTRGSPAIYVSSPGVERSHCARCGSPISYATATEFTIYAATLDDPEAVRPTLHLRSDEQLSWFEIADDLPRYGHGQRAAPLRIGARKPAP